MERAKVKVCQDILMSKLVLSTYKNKLTFKGGTIMYHLTQEKRRATKDIDVDLIQTSIDDKSLVFTFNKIGSIDDGTQIYFEVQQSTIKDLRHDLYKGKTLYLIFKDINDDSLRLKVDIGVHSKIDLMQDYLLLEVLPIKNKVQVLCNPAEQIIIEKTISFLKRGILSTRIKDVYDIFFLFTNQNINKKKFQQYVDSIVIKEELSKNLEDYISNINGVFKEQDILNKMELSDNWLGISNKKILQTIVLKFSKMI